MTKTDVANMALAEGLGLPRIKDIDDTTNKSAIECKAAFDESRIYYLREAAPGFARKETALAILSGETLPTERYDYIYAYPADCLKPVEIYNPNSISTRIKFEQGLASDKTSETILTDQESAILIYTTDVENLNVFQPDDILALSYILAWKVALPLTRKRELKSEAQQNFLALIKIAQKNNKRGQYKDLPLFDDYITARN